ncbi:DUF2071 domain-containing protein [Viridibacillus sp. YIM B01967]|uniref:DUF2071 domain-containing protein n=1 Tax=Viridibacillus soli TaxID=2798301 RepID=A0ABS1H5T1_9BACL|nr:DUF2071 domain-containing protein [Viridibacillus soli]MBK3494762.1 DUF2071 domain-containing protein [Viridibacillus soli]
MTKRPWIMTQEWHDVFFLHWSVSAEDIRKHIPSELELDLFNNRAWISLVFFQVKRNRPRFMPPLLGSGSFLELNVRTYVTHKGKAGVHFFSLDANNSLIVKLTTFRNFLPFRNANITSKKSNNTFTIYSRTKQFTTFPETLIASFEPISRPIKHTQLDRWLTERYHVWVKTQGQLFRVDNCHSPWVLQNAVYTIHQNSLASFLECHYQENHPIVHYSEVKKARFFPPVKEN